MVLPILYQDDHIVVINKPHGLLVHRTALAKHEKVFALQLLRDQINRKVYPVHRLDRKTSGVLVFAFEPETVAQLQKQFNQHKITKRYIAIVRGWFHDEIIVNHTLKNDKGKLQEAQTFFKKIKTTELEIPFGKHNTSRYSLIEAFPKTGRMHQIRKHCNHLRHPIIGDRPHGCNKQNRLFKTRWNMTRMLLHAQCIELTHPVSGVPLKIEGQISLEFERMIKVLGF